MATLQDMFQYDPMQSLPMNLDRLYGRAGDGTPEGSGSPLRGPAVGLTETAVPTAFREIRDDYGGEDAFNIIQQLGPNATLEQINALLAQRGLRPFSSPEELSARNTALPGHNRGNWMGLETIVPGLLAFMGAGAAGAFGPAATGVGASAAPGTAMYSTPAEVGGLFGNASTPAMTTYAGPGGTALGGTTAPAAMGGVAGAATALPIANMSSGIESAPLDGGMGFSAAPETTPSITAPSNVGTGAFDQFGSAAYPSMPEAGTVFGTGTVGGAGTGLGLNANTAQLGLGLYELYRANQMENAYSDLLNSLNDPGYDYRQNDDLVQSFLRDPMAVLGKSPGYQASVDYLTKKGQREMAAKGMTGSGNIGHYLADVLGKNAMDWHRQMWTPISESAGLKNDPNRAQIGQVSVNAMQQAENAKRNARGEIFNAGRQTLPDLFRWMSS